MNESIDLKQLFGRKCKDVITGFEGVCVGIVEHMFGCTDVILESHTTKDRKPRVTPYQFSIERIKVLSSDIALEDITIPEYEAPQHFGIMCRDKVTGYEGYCLSCCDIFYTSRQYFLLAKCKRKKKDRRKSGIWIDEGRLEELEGYEIIDQESVSSGRPGGINGLPETSLPIRVSN